MAALCSHSIKKILCLLCLLTVCASAFSAGKKDTTYQAKPAATRSAAIVYSQQEQLSLALLSDFSKYKFTFDMIMLSALVDAKDGNFTEATREFIRADGNGVTAFTLGRSDFLKQNISRSTINSIDSAINTANSSANEMLNIQKRLQRPYDDFMAAVTSGDFSAAQRAYAQAERYFTQLANLRANIYRAGTNVASLTNQYTSMGTVDTSYLFSLSKLIAGLDGTPGSGLCGVVDQLWDAYAGGMERAVGTLIDEDLKVYASADYEKAKTALTRVNQYIPLAIQIASKKSSLSDSDDLEQQYNVLKTTVADALAFLDVENSFDDLREKMNSMQSSFSSADTLLADARSSNTSSAVLVVQEAQSMSAWAERIQKALSVSSLTDGSLAPWADFSAAYRQKLSVIGRDCSAISSDAWKLCATWYDKAAFAFVSDDTRLLKEAQSFMSSGSSAKQYPKQALESVQKMQETVRADIAVLSAGSKTLSEGGASSVQIGGNLASINNKIETLRGLLSQSDVLAQQAGELSSRAYQAQLDGDTLFRDAQNAYNRRDYTSALQKLEAAAEKYDESLAIQEDAQILEKRNTTLLDLSNRIARAKYENIVREVRQLKDSASTLYYSGEFEAAEASLNRAEQLWTDITVEVDDELERLKTLVNTALTMNIGRVLSTDDPLYPEMSQILSIANRYYSEGLSLKQKGDDSGAQKVLDLAKAKLEELQRVYPLNQAANLLTLRINRLLDPVEFERSFESRMKALSEVNYEARDSLATQSYTELKDLYIINPNYAGISALVNKAEIALGLKQKPVAASTSQRAITIAREAQSLLNRAGSDENLLAQAQERAQEALELDPNNSVAKTVLDEVKLKSGSQDSGVLSSEDEEQFQRAKQLFKNNFIEEAFEVINALAQKNPSSKRIKNLKERIELKL